MDTTHQQSKACPACEGDLEKVQGVLCSAMIFSEGYACYTCKVFYAHDLQPLARLVGGETPS